MTLYKKTYVKNWEHTPKKELHKIEITKGGKEVNTINTDKITYITETIADWRKANAIHKWFVDNVQDGIDDCKAYYVSHEQLQELLDIVNAVLKHSRLVKGKVADYYTFDDKGNKIPHLVDGKVIKDITIAKTLLPTQEGFFFGGTDYNEWYLEDLKYTKGVLTEALKDKHASYEYQSSW